MLTFVTSTFRFVFVCFSDLVHTIYTEEKPFVLDDQLKWSLLFENHPLTALGGDHHSWITQSAILSGHSLW